MSTIDKASWEKVDALLDELLEANPAERAGRLAELQTENPGLARELAALLAHQAAAETDHFLEGTAFDPMEVGALAGRSVGGYTLERPLGQGGMGSVWLARRSDGRYEGKAAIKFLNLALLGRGGAERLRREASVLAKLAHPNITHLIDAGVAAGQPFLVLEYVEGEPIDAWCDRRSLDVSARIRLFLQVLAAVAHAHGRLILHRDLKPSNILITTDGRAKLLDFGIAKLLEGEGHTAPPTELTKLGGAALTPDYAAPEQLQHAEVTTATDIYALGVLLYVLLTGTHPTASETTTPMERMQALVDKEPVRSSDLAAKTDPEFAHARSTSPLQLARALRGDLDNILAKALKKTPNERYATVEAFAEDLQRYLNDEPVSARADSAVYRLSKFVRRHRLAVSAASAIFLALAIGIVGTSWQASEARRQRDQALYQAKRAEFQSRFAYQIMSEVGSDGQPITIRQLMSKGIEVLERNYGDDPRFVIGSLVSISGRYMDLGDTQGEYEALVKAEQIARKLGDPERIAFVQCNTVETELAAGRPEQAAQRMRDGLENLAKISDPPFSRQTDCGTAHSRLLWAQGQSDQAIDAGIDVAKLMEAHGESTDLHYLTAVSWLEIMLQQSGRLGEALQWNDRLMSAHERAGRTGTMSMNLTQARRAAHLYQAGDIAAAHELQRAIVEGIAAQQGVESVNASIANGYGLSQVRLQETDAGMVWLDRAVAEAAAKGNRRVQASALLARARARFMLGELDAAASDLDALDLLGQKNRWEYRGALLAARLLRAESLIARNDARAAIADVDRLLRDLDYPQKKRAPVLADALKLRARAHVALRESAAALADARAAVAAAEALALDPARSADVGAALLVLAQVQHATADVAGAHSSARRAIGILKASLGPQHSQTVAASRFE